MWIRNQKTKTVRTVREVPIEYPEKRMPGDTLLGMLVVMLLFGFIVGFAAAAVDARHDLENHKAEYYQQGYTNGWHDGKLEYVRRSAVDGGMLQSDFPCAEDEVLGYVEGDTKYVRCYHPDK